MENEALATFGAGCFWCVEAVFEQQAGVLDAVTCHEYVASPLLALLKLALKGGRALGGRRACASLAHAPIPSSERRP